MIRLITGEIVERKPQTLVILTASGIGYKVYVTPNTLDQLAGETNATLHTHHAIREDASDLYGFTNTDELDMYETLLTVSGIGPKTALSVLTAANVETIVSAVSHQSPNLLSSLSGIGKKMAEKIVHELKGKLDESKARGEHELASEEDTVTALRGLGFTDRQIKNALKDMDRELPTQEKVKLALKQLSR